MSVTADSSSTAATSFVCVDALSRCYSQGTQAQPVLQGLHFSLQQGETVALLGRSGSGKSTLLNLLAGIDRPDAGKVCIAGTDLSALGEPHSTLFRRRHIGFIYQFFNLIPGLTAAENVALSLELNEVPSAQALLRARQLLRDLGLGGFIDKFPTQLSGGEQQRVAVARALIHAPALVLADEPTGNLDAQTGNAMLAWLRAQLRTHDSTCLLVTHSLAVARTADRILTLENGYITERSGEFAW